MAQEGPKSALIGPQEGPGSQPKDNKGGGALQYQSQFSAWSELQRVVNSTSSLLSSLPSLNLDGSHSFMLHCCAGTVAGLPQAAGYL